MPIVFKFENLKPKTKYTVRFDPSINQIKSSFTTLPKQPDGNLRLAIFSCNESQHMLSKPLESDLWADMQRRIERGEIDYMLHMGDSVYMDIGIVGR